jgi:hypothetical protein
MSLNGLDDAKVKEAHDAAIAEPGGWYELTISPGACPALCLAGRTRLAQHLNCLVRGLNGFEILVHPYFALALLTLCLFSN